MLWHWGNRITMPGVVGFSSLGNSCDSVIDPMPNRMYIYIIYSNASCPQLVAGSKLHELVAIGSHWFLLIKTLPKGSGNQGLQKKTPMPKSAAAFFFEKQNLSKVCCSFQCFEGVGLGFALQKLRQKLPG